jgi:phosphohistidine swiveling domain-containing protein
MAYGMDLWEFNEAEDLKNYKAWVLNAAFCVPPWTPLYFELWMKTVPYCNFRMAAMPHWPFSHGWEWRIYKGYGYCSSTLTTEQEKKEREPRWREALAPFAKDPFGWWDMWKPELSALYDRLMAFDLGTAEDLPLVIYLKDLYQAHRRVWEIHMEATALFAPGYAIFRDVVRNLLGLADYGEEFSKLLGGFDNEMYASQRGIVKLAATAMEMKLEDHFKLPADEVLPALEQSAGGRKWLQDFNEYMKKYGFRQQRLVEICTPSWMEKPSLAVREIKRCIDLGGVHAADREHERLVKEGEEAVKDALAKVPEGQKDLLMEAIRLGQGSAWLQEEHDWWCEFHIFPIVRRGYMEAARRLVQKNQIDEVDDIFYLLTEEIYHALMTPNAYIKLHGTVKERRAEHQEYVNFSPPFILGDPQGLMELVASEPCMGLIAGMPLADADEVGALCVGASSAPGVVEGPARVVFNEAQWDEIIPGEIVISPLTSASWTHLFNIVGGLVTDGGGSFSHAVIVAREYGVPTVVGTQDATRKIKTGDRIRVDGNLARVYAL